MSIMYKGKQIAGNEVSLSEVRVQVDKGIEKINTTTETTKNNAISEINSVKQSSINQVRTEGANQIALATEQAEIATRKAIEAVGVPIGTEISIASSSTYIPEGAVLEDGAEYNKTQFPTLWENYIETNLLNTCTYDEYENDLIKYGECSKFAIDTTNNKFRVPFAESDNLIKFIVISDGIINESEMDWSNYMTALDGKADKTYYQINYWGEND